MSKRRRWRRIRIRGGGGGGVEISWWRRSRRRNSSWRRMRGWRMVRRSASVVSIGKQPVTWAAAGKGNISAITSNDSWLLPAEAAHCHFVRARRARARMAFQRTRMGANAFPFLPTCATTGMRKNTNFSDGIINFSAVAEILWRNWFYWSMTPWARPFRLFWSVIC